MFLSLLFMSKRKDYRILKFKRGVGLQIKELGQGSRGDIAYGIDRYTCLSSWRQCPAWFIFVISCAKCPDTYITSPSSFMTWICLKNSRQLFPKISLNLHSWYFPTTRFRQCIFFLIFFFGICATEMMCPSQCLISGVWCSCLMAVADNLVYTWLKQLFIGFPSVKLLFFPSQLINIFR